MAFRNRPRGWDRTARRILARDGRICWLCGKPGATSVDHVIPRAKGGSHADWNLRAAHMRCNASKGSSNRQSADLPALRPKMVMPRARGSRWT